MNDFAGRFAVLFEGQRIGSTNLEFADPGMGIAYGRFYAEDAYENVRAPIVRAAEARHAGIHSPLSETPRLELSTRTGEASRPIS